MRCCVALFCLLTSTIGFAKGVAPIPLKRSGSTVVGEDHRYGKPALLRVERWTSRSGLSVVQTTMRDPEGTNIDIRTRDRNGNE